MNRVSRVLVVDDEPAIRRALSVNLVARGYLADLASTGAQALALAAANHPDIVILDLGLPDLDGIDVIHGLRGWSAVPILVLSARDNEQQKVEALDAGADDYLTKPFGMDELFARLRSALRRQKPIEESAVVATADFTLDLANRSAVRADGRDCRLTPTEWQVVEVLVRNPGRLVTQRHLVQQVWNTSAEIDSGLMRVHLAHIRRKLEPDPARPKYFLTEPRMGYRFLSTD